MRPSCSRWPQRRRPGDPSRRSSATGLPSPEQDDIRDRNCSDERAEFLAYWAELLLSGCEDLLRSERVSQETVDGMKEELDLVGHDPNAVFFHSFVQARAKVG